MNYKEKINSFFYCTLILHLCTSSFYGIFSSYIISKTKNSSLLSLLLGFIFSLIISKIIFAFVSYKEDLNYVEKIKYLFPKTSKIVNIISILCSIFGYILITYRLTTFLSNHYLINTPRYLISLLIIIFTYYAYSKGIQTIIRISFVTFIISIINFFFDFFSLLNQINIENLLPVIDVNYITIIKSSILFSLYFSIPLIYLNVISLNQITNKKNLKKYYYIMISLSFIIIFISTFTSISVNTSNVCSLFDYPIYSTLKRIRLFSFIDSLENISISAWFLFIINISNMMIIYIFNGIKDTFNISNTFIYKFIILTFVFIIQNFVFSNNNFNESHKYILIPVIFLSISLLIIIISLLKSKINRN